MFHLGGNEDTRKVHLLSWETLQRRKHQGRLGVCFARQENLAFLTKLGWRILAEPNSLWARVLLAKYCKGWYDVDMFEPNFGMSNVWNGITENARVLCEGIQTA